MKTTEKMPEKVSITDSNIDLDDKFTIYLAGSIRQDIEEFCRQWREEIRIFFEDHDDILVIDPIEGKDLDDEFDPSTIYVQDMYNVMHSDLIFIEMVRNDYPYIGSILELHQAYESFRDVIVWGGKHEHHLFVQAMMKHNERYYGWMQAVNAMIIKVNNALEKDIPIVGTDSSIVDNVVTTYIDMFIEENGM